MSTGNGGPPRGETQLFGQDKSSRASTIHLAQKIEEIDGDAALNEYQLFDIVDSDNSGSISRDEFSKVVQVIKTNMVRTHRQATKAEADLRRMKLMKSALVLLLCFTVMNLAGNMGLSYAVYKFSKDFRISTTDHNDGHAEMRDRQGKVVETGVSLYTSSLLDVSNQANFDIFDRIEELQIPGASVTNGSLLEMDVYATPTRSVRIQSWKWMDVGHMVFTAMDDTKVLISNGLIDYMDPANGVVAFDASDAPWASDVNAQPVLNSFVGTCAAHNCPKSECSAHTSDGDLSSVMCNGVSVWQWPQGVVLTAEPHERRELTVKGGGDKCYGSTKLRNCKRRCPASGGLPAQMRCHRKCQASCAAASVRG